MFQVSIFYEFIPGFDSFDFIDLTKKLLGKLIF